MSSQIMHLPGVLDWVYDTSDLICSEDALVELVTSPRFGILSSVMNCLIQCKVDGKAFVL